MPSAFQALVLSSAAHTHYELHKKLCAQIDNYGLECACGPCNSVVMIAPYLFVEHGDGGSRLKGRVRICVTFDFRKVIGANYFNEELFAVFFSAIMQRVLVYGLALHVHGAMVEVFDGIVHNMNARLAQSKNHHSRLGRSVEALFDMKSLVDADVIKGINTRHHHNLLSTAEFFANRWATEGFQFNFVGSPFKFEDNATIKKHSGLPTEDNIESFIYGRTGVAGQMANARRRVWATLERYCKTKDVVAIVSTKMTYLYIVVGPYEVNDSAVAGGSQSHGAQKKRASSRGRSQSRGRAPSRGRSQSRGRRP